MMRMHLGGLRIDHEMFWTVFGGLMVFPKRLIILAGFTEFLAGDLIHMDTHFDGLVAVDRLA